MARQTRVVIAQELPFDPAAAEAFFTQAKHEWQIATRKDFKIGARAKAVGINPGIYGQILSGKRRAVIQQCRVIAHDLGVSVDAVLRVEGYLDLATLIAWVEADKMRRYPGEKESILRTLHMALESKRWQETDWRKVTFRERADFILASELDPYTKAAFYADEVHDFSEMLQQTRWERSTGENLINAS